MKIGLVGLGRMGAGMRERIRRGGHEVVGYDRNQAVVAIHRRSRSWWRRCRRAALVWLMVPSGDITQSTIEDVATLLAPGDIVIDGGNSYSRTRCGAVGAGGRRHPLRRHAARPAASGAFDEGFCLMVGRPNARPSTSSSRSCTRWRPRDGYAYVGPAAPGTSSKMVHNGIEYGMLQAYAEGFELLQAARVRLRPRPDRRRSGTTAASCVRGCWSSAEDAFERDPNLEQSRLRRRLRRGPLDRAGGGRARHARLRSSRSPCSPASRPATTTRSPCASSPRCATSSAGTRSEEA